MQELNVNALLSCPRDWRLGLLSLSLSVVFLRAVSDRVDAGSYRNVEHSQVGVSF